MRIRTKLFLLLIVISVVPLLALSWRSERATVNLGLAVAERGKVAVADEIKNQLAQAITYSSDILSAQQNLTETALRAQAAEVEYRLAAPPPAAVPAIYMHGDFDDPRTWPPGTELGLDHVIIAPGRAQQAVPVSRLHQSFLLAPGVSGDAVRPDMMRLAAMGVVYGELASISPGLFYWQYTALENGVMATYPGHGGFPPGYDPRRRAWYQSAFEANGVVWAPPLLDASTRRLLLTAAMPVRGPDGAVAGVTAIDVEILDVLTDLHGRLRLGDRAESFIVRIAGQDAGAPVLRVIASSSYRDSGASWDAEIQEPELAADTPGGIAPIVADLTAGRGGMRELPHNGADAIWVYGPIEGLRAALLYILPVDALETMADQAQDSIRRATGEQVRLAGIASIVLMALVAVLAMVAAGSITGPLRELAAVARSLARGNLEARAESCGSDEVGELAEVFNAMVPQLRSHIQVKESLSLARDVQQKLLPSTAPQVPGFDVAGHCAYSEAVGGDYYDFLTLTDETGKHRLGVALGDVSGHGVVAALTMTSVRALLRSHAGDGQSLLPAMRAINHHIANDVSDGIFVTMVYMVIDPGTRSVKWISAGHGPILFYDAVAGTFEEMEAYDIPLGVKGEWVYRSTGRDDWPEKGVLVIGTDGIWEAQNADGAMFGKEGLMDAVRESAHLSAAAICDAVADRMAAFTGGAAQKDDATLVIIKFLPRQ